MSHPYIPSDLVIPAYTPLKMGYIPILQIFFSITAVLLIICLVLSAMAKLSGKDRFVFTWFVFTGIIHIAVEGYWVVFWKIIPGDSFYLSELWKEYAVPFHLNPIIHSI